MTLANRSRRVLRRMCGFAGLMQYQWRRWESNPRKNPPVSAGRMTRLLWGGR